MENIHQSYITNILIKEITEKLLPNKILDYKVKHSGGLDGFMSALYSITISILNTETNTESTRELLAKFMKGKDNFRISSRSYIQFANEICIYSKVIPYFSEVLKKCHIKSVEVETWVPKAYVAKYGNIEGLNNCCNTSNECVLVLENLKPHGYALGPHLYLNKEHLLAMVKPLAEYHAMTYALRILKDPVLEELVSSIIPLPFIAEDKSTNMYDALYQVAFDRFFDYFERSKDNLLCKKNENDSQLGRSILKLKEEYGQNPTELLEKIRLMTNEDDYKFAAILHGDFNRNNVMFRYELSRDIPEDARMIDFQEVRFGSPCIDLTFAMYLNLDRSIRDECWMDIIKHYHNYLYNTMSIVLTKSDENMLPSLEEYSFDEFYKHFIKYAFYGVMVCMHFLPWLVGTKEELETLATWFERDMHSKEFRKISFEAGGDDANQRLFEIIKHAHKMGYLDAILV